MKYDKILRSGDHERIAREIPLNLIIEHFGEESPEYYARERLIAEPIRELVTVYERQIEPEQDEVREPIERTYTLPGCFENPTARKTTLEGWLRNFYRMNGKELLDDFETMKFNSMKAMYHRIRREYGFNVDDIVKIDPDLN